MSDVPLVVSSSAISGNTAVTSGPDIFQNPSATGALTLTNDLVSNPAGAVYTESPAGSNVLGQDAGLGALADNGGPTQTQLPSSTSPLLDAGLANSLTTDQRGLSRTVDFPDFSSTHGSDGTDIGAVELGLPDRDITNPAVSADKSQLVGGKIKVVLTAGAGEDVDVLASGAISAKDKQGGKSSLKAKSYPLAQVQAAAPAGTPATIVLKPASKKSSKKIKGALKSGGKAKAAITVVLTDAAGNQAEQDLSVKLKAKKKKGK